jgi:hypothetical protein
LVSLSISKLSGVFFAIFIFQSYKNMLNDGCET